MSPGSATVHQPLRGVLLLGGAVLLFAAMDTTTKVLAEHYPVPLVMAIRYIVHCLLMVVLLTPTQGLKLVETRRTRLVLLRALCLAAASLFMGLALQRMPVAEATAIIFLAPLLVVLAAGKILRERVGLLAWVCALTGFAGVLLIVRPGGGLDPVGVACALCGAAAIAAYQLLSRLLASTERTVALLFYAALVGSLLFGISLPWYWEGQAPSPLQALLFAGMGVMGGVGHYLFTAAHRHAPASFLAPLMYIQLVWAGLLGWLVFGHVSNAASIVGMLLVAGSGAVVALRSRLSRRTLAAAAQG